MGALQQKLYAYVNIYIQMRDIGYLIQDYRNLLKFLGEKYSLYVKFVQQILFPKCLILHGNSHLNRRRLQILIFAM